MLSAMVIVTAESCRDNGGLLPSFLYIKLNRVPHNEIASSWLTDSRIIWGFITLFHADNPSL